MKQMTSAIRTPLLLLLLLGATVASNIVFAQSVSDVSVRAWGGAPQCTGNDAEIYMSNASSVYDYRVRLNLRAENNSPGEEKCGTACASERCKCDLSGTEIVNAGDNDIKKDDCLLPNCDPIQCPQQCDDIGSEGECDPIHHCTCIFGTYQVTDYSADGGETWLPLLSSPTTLTETDRTGITCPTPECEY